MPDVDTDQLIWIVTGVQLNAELGDRPLAYRVEQELRIRLTRVLPPVPKGELPRLSPAVISDVFYLNNDTLHDRPTISIGGPGVNALSALLVDRLPTVMSIQDTLVIQMDMEMKEHDQCSIWGMTHLDTVRAVDLFITRYLDPFVAGVVSQMPQ